MVHVRTQIRAAVKAALNGLFTTGANVFVMRPTERPLQVAELPALQIYMDDEQTAEESLDFPVVVRREATLRVEAVAQTGGQPVEDTLDNITAEVEVALASNPTLGGLVKSAELTGISTEIDAEGATPVGRQTLNFALIFYTRSTAPDTAI